MTRENVVERVNELVFGSCICSHMYTAREMNQPVVDWPS